MRQIKDNTKHKKYKHFREKERYKLEALVDEKIKILRISRILNKHPSTIYRELRRGKISRLDSELIEKEVYRANVAQRRYENNISNRERDLKIGKDHKLVEYIKDKIVNDKYSPDAVLGEIQIKQLEFKTKICTKTLYNYIERGFLEGISHKNLWERGCRKKKRRRKIQVCVKNRKGLHISERPPAVEKREEYGHWEIDCIKSGKKKSKAVILTLTERKTREEKLVKMLGATVENVDRALTSLEKKYKRGFKIKFKSLTADNGSEFLDYERLQKSSLFKDEKRTTIYFATPYSSWERGSNENQNRMIRRFIPKGSDISKINEKIIKEIENWMNNYPRKILDYRSANDLVNEFTKNVNFEKMLQ